MQLQGFIRLTNLLINTRHIKIIELSNTKYIIHMNSNLNDIYGLSLFSSGFISGSSSHKNIEICSVKNSVDFLKLKEFLEN